MRRRQNSSKILNKGTDVEEQKNMKLSRPVTLGKKKFDVFISHHQVAAASLVAATLQIEFENVHKLKVFFDIETDLLVLNDLLDKVRASKCVLLLLTEKVLTRPFCLAEIFTALTCGIPVVTVLIKPEPFIFEEQWKSLALMDKTLNDGALKTLREYGIDPISAAYVLNKRLPHIVTKEYDTNQPVNVRVEQMHNIWKAIKAEKDTGVTPMTYSSEEVETWTAVRETSLSGVSG
jgi:hypothetical protein